MRRCGHGAIAVLALAALLATACASLPAAGPAGAGEQRAQRQEIYEAFRLQLQTAVKVYQVTLVAAGAAAERGDITEEELDQIATVGLRAKTALEAARFALATAIELDSGNPWPAIAAAQAALLELAGAAGKVTS